MKNESRYYLMLKPASREQGQQFKECCRKEGLSMNKALILFMSGVIKGNIVFRQKAIVRK